jgi:hypothetical protein
MIKIFIPINKGRNKTDIRGFWLNDNGKLFYDYITILNLKKSAYILKQLETFRQYYNQEALFFTIKNKGYIYTKGNKIDVLNKHSIIEVKRLGRNTKLLKDYIRSALRLYKGLTIYIKSNSYILEVYYK